VSSPITFSGFNSIDFNQVLEAVMIQERSPLTRLETQKKTLESQNTAFSTLAGKLATLETAIENLGKADSLALLTATSSNAGVGVSATGGTVTGTYDITVTELARAQSTSSASTYGALTDEVATGGTLTLTPADGGAAVTITLSGPTTLSGLAAAINANEDSPAAASVVQTSPGQYRLVLSGKETGASNAFTITDGLTGGLGVTFTDTDGDGVSGDSAEDNSQTALNAALTVNGLPVTSASNTVTDVVPGATLSLTKKDPDTVVTVKVNRDTTAAKDLVKKFITAYNDLTTFAKDQNTAAIAGKASIGRDPLLRGMRDALRNAINGDYDDDGGAYTRLAAIGIGFDMTGKMTLDDKLFEKAANKPADLQLLLSGADGKSGAFGAMTKLVEEYTQTGGLLGSIRERNDEQIRGLSRRIDSSTAQLELRRLALQREYIAADLAMTRLKSQSSALSSIGGQYRLF
jgi:flagellar hook-associated protein 2